MWASGANSCSALPMCEHHGVGSRYRSGRSPDWLKFKNPDAPAVKRERPRMIGGGNDDERTRPFRQSGSASQRAQERIARQRGVIKQAKLRGHSTAAAETIQRTLHQSLRAFEQRRQQVFERLEAKQRPTLKREAEEDWGR
jgi:hypothetical protein